MGSPAGSAWSGNPIRKRAGGSTTCSVEVLFVSSRGSSDGDWWFCCVRMAPLALGTCREQSIVGCWTNGVLLTCSCIGPFAVIGLMGACVASLGTCTCSSWLP